MPAGRPKGSSGVNKSAAIRDYLNSHPEASTTEVMEALGSKGIDVSQALVAGVRAKAFSGDRPARKKSAAPQGEVTAAELNTVQAVIEKFEEPDVFLTVVEDVCGLIAGLGSVERLEAVLKAYSSKSDVAMSESSESSESDDSDDDDDDSDDSDVSDEEDSDEDE
jgi:phosphopantothenoylcysteine synthetase/decarboxylase